MEQFLYLFLLLASISYPLSKSWDKQLNYSKNWKALFPSIGIMMLLMVSWDVLFTKWGVWGFNPAYNLGVNIFGLPIEEWLFFICIPFSCMFIYEVVAFFDKKNRFDSSAKWISLSLFVVVLLLFFLSFGQVYTQWTMTAIGFLLIYQLLNHKKTASYLGRFYFSYLFVLVPFIIINGVLTGSFIEDQVVWYNMEETFGIRIGTVPFEDFFYCLFMLLMTVTSYELIQKKLRN